MEPLVIRADLYVRLVGLIMQERYRSKDAASPGVFAALRTQSWWDEHQFRHGLPVTPMQELARQIQDGTVAEAELDLAPYLETRWRYPSRLTRSFLRKLVSALVESEAVPQQTRTHAA